MDLSRRHFGCYLMALASTALPSLVAASSDTRTFRVGAFVLSLVGASFRDTQIGISLMLDEVANELGWKIEVEMYEDVTKFHSDIDNGSIDLAVGSPTQLLSVYDRLAPEKYYLFELDGKKTRRFGIVVRADSDFQTLKDLAGKRMLIVKGTDIGAVFLEDALVKAGQQGIQSHFRDVQSAANYDEAINHVFFGQSDAALVTPIAHKVAGEFNPQIASATRIVEISDELVTAMTFPVGPRADSAAAFEHLMTTMHQRPRGKSLLKLFGADSIVVGDATQLSGVRKLLNQSRIAKAD